MFRFNRKELTAAYQSVFNTKEGKLVLHDLLRAAHVFKSSCVPGDPNLTHFQEGERNVALRILAFLGSKEVDIVELAEESRNFTVGENYAGSTDTSGEPI